MEMMTIPDGMLPEYFKLPNYFLVGGK